MIEEIVTSLINVNNEVFLYSCTLNLVTIPIYLYMSRLILKPVIPIQRFKKRKMKSYTTAFTIRLLKE